MRGVGGHQGTWYQKNHEGDLFKTKMIRFDLMANIL